MSNLRDPTLVTRVCVLMKFEPKRFMNGFFEKCWPKKIWQQLFLFLIALAVIPLVVLGSLLVVTSQQAVRTTVLRDHKELAIRAAGQINEFIRKPKELLVTVASIMGVSHADAWSQETAMVELALRYPMFRRVSSVGVDGGEIAVSRLGSEKINRSKDPAFIQAREGRVYISTVQVFGKNTPVVTMAVPLTRWGRVQGVLMAEVDLRGMWDIVDSIYIGMSGYACVIDRSGFIISHPNKKLILGHESIFSKDVAGRVLSGQVGSGEASDPAGKLWLASYAPVIDTGWGLLIFQSTGEAYASSGMMQAQSWFFIMLAILASFIISLYLARFVSRPLNMLLEGTRRISKKDYDHPLPVTREDEIGQIFTSFNVMVGELKQAQQAEKLSVVGKAVTSIVHELKNSVVLVDTYIQMLKENYKDKNFIKDFISVVPQQLNAWRGMLQNMVDYARVPRYPLELVDVRLLLEEVARLSAYRIKEHGAHFELVLVSEPLWVRGNADKLKQVVMNLLSNALDATLSSGKVRLFAMLESGGDPGLQRVVVGVENSGKFIPQEQISKMFEPFFTTKPGGLGLGLAICREIVERHGGVIDVTSSPEGITMFRLKLCLENGARNAA